MPVLLYDAWLFFGSPDFAVFSSHAFQFPPRADFVWALGPAAALAVTWVMRRGPAADARAAGLYFAGWATAGALILMVRPLSFSLQFLAGIGLRRRSVGNADHLHRAHAGAHQHAGDVGGAGEVVGNDTQRHLSMLAQRHDFSAAFGKSSPATGPMNPAWSIATSRRRPSEPNSRRILRLFVLNVGALQIFAAKTGALGHA